VTKGLSCTTHLLTAFELWTSWIDAGFGVDVVYLDYRKAFYSVDHVKLIDKLSNNIIVKWLNGLQHFSRIERYKLKWNWNFLTGQLYQVESLRLSFGAPAIFDLR